MLGRAAWVAFVIWAALTAVFLSEMVFAAVSPLPWGAAGLLILAALGPAAALGAAAAGGASKPAAAPQMGAPRAAPSAKPSSVKPSSVKPSLAKPEPAAVRPPPRKPAAAPGPQLATPGAKPIPTRPKPPDPDPQSARAPEQEPQLPLETGPEPEPVDWLRAARALEFPRHAEDADALAAIRYALGDPELAQLLQAAEDVMTMLASEGVHMEDYPPDHAQLADWRAYAEGEGGVGSLTVGGVRDAAAIEKTRARQHRDAIFRDASLVFVRRWRAMVRRALREGGGEDEVRALADSRSGRAFMLVGAAIGAFN